MLVFLQFHMLPHGLLGVESESGCSSHILLSKLLH